MVRDGDVAIRAAADLWQPFLPVHVKESSGGSALIAQAIRYRYTEQGMQIP